MSENYIWNAQSFFQKLTVSSKLAADMKAKFCSVSGPQGFEDMLATMKTTPAFVAVCSEEEGSLDLENTSRSKVVYIVFIALRYKIDSMEQRKKAMAKIRRLFSQFLSVMIQEKTRLEQECIYIDQSVPFKEIDKYFFPCAACAFFQISVTRYSDISYNPDEWIEQPIQMP